LTTEQTALDLLRSAERSAIHLETRDSYTPDDPDWLEWKAGNRFDPATREVWRTFSALMKAAVGRGVIARRARIVSEPVTDYVRYEYDVTVSHNLAAGEQVRWLPRRQTAGLLVPPNDFWVFDERVVMWNHFAGDGSWLAQEATEDMALAKLCVSSFDAVWERAIPHEQYRPA
jgi:hypothetical protein